MKAVMTQYIGKEIVLDFYEDEEDIDMLDTSKHNKFTLMDVDEKWALIHIEKPKKSVEKLIRLSSIKGFSLKECKSE